MQKARVPWLHFLDYVSEDGSDTPIPGSRPHQLACHPWRLVTRAIETLTIWEHTCHGHNVPIRRTISRDTRFLISEHSKTTSYALPQGTTYRIETSTTVVVIKSSVVAKRETRKRITDGWTVGQWTLATNTTTTNASQVAKTLGTHCISVIVAMEPVEDSDKREVTNLIPASATVVVICLQVGAFKWIACRQWNRGASARAAAVACS